MKLCEVFRRIVLQEVERECPPAQTGRPRAIPDAEALDAMFKVLRTGTQWRELTCEVSHTTVFRRMQLWCRHSVFDKAYTRVLTLHSRLRPPKLYCVDSSYVKNAFGRNCVGRNHTDRGRKALKVSVLVDHTGVPHGMCCHPGNRPDVTLLADTLSSKLRTLEALPLYADKGYDSRNNRKVCLHMGLADRIMRRRTKTTRRTNAKRIVVEHTFSWMKSFRRLSHFYEHDVPPFRGFLLLAFGHLVANRVDRFRDQKSDHAQKASR